MEVCGESAVSTPDGKLKEDVNMGKHFSSRKNIYHLLLSVLPDR